MCNNVSKLKCFNCHKEDMGILHIWKCQGLQEVFVTHTPSWISGSGIHPQQLDKITLGLVTACCGNEAASVFLYKISYTVFLRISNIALYRMKTKSHIHPVSFVSGKRFRSISSRLARVEKNSDMLNCTSWTRACLPPTMTGVQGGARTDPISPLAVSS